MAWSGDFSSDFGPISTLSFPVSQKDAGTMSTLALTATETLLYDYSETEQFYVLVVPPEVEAATLYLINPVYAAKWLRLNAGSGLRVLYNPFMRVAW